VAADFTSWLLSYLVFKYEMKDLAKKISPKIDLAN
jgi:hypothetical protein